MEVAHRLIVQEWERVQDDTRAQDQTESDD